MRKVLSALLLFFFALTIVGCGGKSNTSKKTTNKKTTNSEQMFNTYWRYAGDNERSKDAYKTRYNVLCSDTETEKNAMFNRSDTWYCPLVCLKNLIITKVEFTVKNTGNKSVYVYVPTVDGFGNDGYGTYGFYKTHDISIEYYEKTTDPTEVKPGETKTFVTEYTGDNFIVYRGDTFDPEIRYVMKGDKVDGAYLYGFKMEYKEKIDK